MTDEGRAALLALAHCGCVQSHWAHPGYAELHSLRMTSHYPADGDKRSWYLLKAGRDKVRKLFGFSPYAY